jgi:putative flippase GtrA
MVKLQKHHIKQIATFGIVGVINTISDFTIFNVLYGLLHVPLFLANVIAVTLVMSVSLQLNRKYVFGATDKSYSGQAAKFVIVTVVGLYVIQNVILFAVLRSLEGMHITSGLLASHIIQANIAKAVGVGGSAVWDFALYKVWVFRKNSKQIEPEQQKDYL